MIQCALNGDYTRADHPDVPGTLAQIVADAQACWEAGAASVHFHPRDVTGEHGTLDARTHDAVVTAVRAALPQLEISCSTAEGIDLGGARDRRAAVAAWQAPPDLVSLNVREPGSLALGETLRERGIGIEAGVFTLDDAEILLGAPWAADVRRVLVEVIFQSDDAGAVTLAQAIDEAVAPLGRPRLWHGDGRASWAVVDAALAAGHDVRVGLEDSIVARDGGPAPSNAGQVAALPAAARAGRREALVDLARVAECAAEPYDNLVLTAVDDHVIRMSVMTEPFHWHRHPDGDETFLVVEGVVLLQTSHQRVELRPGRLYTVPAGVAHVTRPLTPRSVNLTVERAGMTTEPVAPPR